MSAWLVVVASTCAVGVPLVLGWWWSERHHRRRAAGLLRNVEAQDEALEVLRGELARAAVKASGLAASAMPGRANRLTDLQSSLSLLHEAMRARELELGAYRRRYRSSVVELAEVREQNQRLLAAESQRLAEDRAFQLHLGQVTDERDRLKRVFTKDPGFRAQRLQLRAAKRELEELRMKLRTANAALVKLEKERSEEVRLLDALLAPVDPVEERSPVQ
jgi:hypothetical protein